MPDLKMAKAVIIVRRTLTPRELATIRFALCVLEQVPPRAGVLDELSDELDGEPLLSDVDIRSLVYELSLCEKVKVCRSTRHEP